MKKCLMKMLAGFLACTLVAGCAQKPADPSSSEISNTEESGQEGADMTGGWTLNENAAAVLPEEAAKAFEAAEMPVGASYEPVALIATQVVAGLNYMMLCKTTPAVQNPVPGYAMVVLYADLTGKVTVTKVTDVDLAALRDTEGNAPENGLAGGWLTDEAQKACELPEGAEKAFEGLTGVSYEPISVLASQVVAGSNYAILCRASVMSQEGASYMALVYLYCPIGADASVLSILPIDPAEFNK